MKKLFLLIATTFIAGTTFSQEFYMQGRFVNTNPDISLDSAAFEFTPTNYEYFINDATTPSSSGTYEVIDGIFNPDSIILYEDTLGVCATNGGGKTIRFEVGASTNPFYAVTLFETSFSVDSCPTHSHKMSGQYIGYNDGVVIYPTSVSTLGEASSLGLYSYGNRIYLTADENETVNVAIMDMNGRKLGDPRKMQLSKGQPQTYDVGWLSPGVYIAVVTTARERKTLRFIL